MRPRILVLELGYGLQAGRFSGPLWNRAAPPTTFHLPAASCHQGCFAAIKAAAITIKEQGIRDTQYNNKATGDMSRALRKLTFKFLRYQVLRSTCYTAAANRK